MTSSMQSCFSKHVTSLACRRRRKRIWLIILVIFAFSSAFLTLALNIMRSAQPSLTIELLDSWSLANLKGREVLHTEKSILLSAEAFKLDNSTENLSRPIARQATILESTAPLCSIARQKVKSLSLAKITVIISLHNIKSSKQAFRYLQRNLGSITSDISDDVIVTVDKILPAKDQDQIEEAVQECDVCRLFFLHGTIYEQRNFASRFARREILLFLDARVQFSPDWLQYLLLNFEVKRIVSPVLQLISTDDNFSTVGVTLNDLQWDLNVVRGRADGDRIKAAVSSGLTYLSQTVLTREVFLIGKQFFEEMGYFESPSGLTGSEHVMLSIKVWNCGGEVVVDMCSSVYLTLSEMLTSTQPNIASNSPFPDFLSPTFHVSLEDYPSRHYTEAIANIFLDAFPSRYYRCVSHDLNLTKYNQEPSYIQQPFHGPGMKYQQISLTPSRQRLKMEQRTLKFLKFKHCFSKNMKQILKDHQPTMESPTRYASHYGYLRTMDGMWAMGLTDFSSQEKLETKLSWTSMEGKLSLTRNSSLWVGPFSYTNGAFIYQHKWCVTSLPNSLFSLSKCVTGERSQLFTYKDYVIRPALEDGKSACVILKPSLSTPVFLNTCQGQNFSNKFKMDVHFIKNCVT